MALKENLTALRKRGGCSQEELAARLGVARQTVSAWETGQAVPELDALMAIAALYGVTLDSLVHDGTCGRAVLAKSPCEGWQSFLLRAKRHTYAARAAECAPCRLGSHDYRWQEGDFLYIDSWLGGERFAGEEAVWQADRSIWAMNYAGRTLDASFSGDFLKEALMRVPEDAPFRGPALFTRGDYTYHCGVQGDSSWFCGEEEIYCAGKKVYICRFHGETL